MRAAEPFDLGQLRLRNRLVGTAHGRGILEDGLPLPEDAEYWRRRAAGGVAMLTVGGTVVAPESTWRRRITTEAWRREAVPGMAAARRGDPCRGRGRGVPARAPRPRDDRRRAVVPPGRAVGGALAARADAAAPADRRRARRDRRGLPHLGRQRGRGGLRGHRAARGARLPARPVPVGGDEPPARRRIDRRPARDRRADRPRDPRLGSAGRRRHPALGRRRGGGGPDRRRALRAAPARGRARRLREPHGRRAHDLRARHGDRAAAAARRGRPDPAARRRAAADLARLPHARARSRRR